MSHYQHRPAQSPRDGYYFLLDQKVAKNQVSKKASLPHKAFAPQIAQNRGLEIFCPPPQGLPSCKSFLCPCRPQTTIVLSAFARSYFADAEKKGNPVFLFVILSGSEGSISELCIADKHADD